MKKLLVCQLVDHASESIVSTFTAPTLAIMQRNFKAFVEDCKGKGIPVEPFVCFVAAIVDVSETYEDACDAIYELRAQEKNDCVLFVGDDENGLETEVQ